MTAPFSIAPALNSGTNELVVLPEQVAQAEHAVEEVEALLGDLEDVVRVEVFGRDWRAAECLKFAFQGDMLF